ncbi:YbjN domain-containing protein [Saprospira grandis]|uniref:Uncharacterized protein n=1 Tax=Saprospira grandis (strain Lewin) TaxID=984262 RepID=H6L2M3_SAPGL|nr:YbjN domain-containing protein [Saprospira grandis]AFC24780.1 hypothetical protein SGRA_2049 [Saprospira grandis str. Lewin]WBM76177.1 YbjN domain-containing protein [Saprospira grandis]
MQNIEETYKLIEGALEKLGLEPEKCKGKEAGSWTIAREQQEIWIDCWEIEENEHKDTYFQVLTPILQIPAEMTVPFYREVLEFNYNMYGMAFGIFKDLLAIKSIREVRGLDESEVIATISRAWVYATDIKPQLMDKYFDVNPGAAPDQHV